MTVVRTLALLAGAAALTAAATRSQRAPEIAYPEGYRDWHHVKSMVILPGHPLENPFGGVHHIYANPAALPGLGEGRFADGAVLVFDLLEAAPGDHAIQEGSRKLIGVMQRDSRRFGATGGWGFEGFKGDSKTERLVTDGGASCFACHQSAAPTYVFAKLRS